MSILDAKLVLSDAQAVTSTADSETVLKLSGTALVNKGIGTPLYLHVVVNTTCTATGAGTVTFTLKTADTSACGTSVIITPAIGKATLVKGYNVLNVPLPSSVLASFVKMTYTVATGPLTAGKFDAWIDLSDGKAN